MKEIQVGMSIVVLMVFLGPLVAGGASPRDLSLHKAGPETTEAAPDDSSRHRRQDDASTTPRPKKNRPSNLFRLISVLVSETREDTNRAFNEIGTLFNSQFARNNSTTMKLLASSTVRIDLVDSVGEISGTMLRFTRRRTQNKKEPTISTEPPSTSTSASAADDENEVATTTEPFRVSREEFLAILRSNVQGLVNLFGKEFRVAIKDSNENVREFGRDLGLALRPFFN